MGGIISALGEAFPPASKFNVDSIPDLSGKVMLVTGGNTGIGKETVKALLQHNAKVYLAGRSEEKCKAAIADLREETGREAIWLNLDLADLASVKAAAKEFLSKEKALHSLFNNAGVMLPPLDQLTTQGYDLQFGTNVLGHFYFTTLILPALTEAAKTDPIFKARIVNTSSVSHAMGFINFNALKDSPTRRRIGRIDLYAQSKFGNVVFAKELSRRYSSLGIVSTSLNPGNLDSDLPRHIPKFLQLFMRLFWLHPVALGALTQLWAGASVEGAGFDGQYLIPWARPGKPIKSSESEVLGKELWTWLEEQVNLFEQSQTVTDQ